MVVDQEHRILRANSALAVRLGTTVGDLAGEFCHLVCHGGGEPTASCPHVRSMLDGEPHAADLCEPRLGGHFRVSALPLHDGRGRRVGSLHVAQDVTRLRDAIGKLAREQEVLQTLYAFHRMSDQLGAREIVDYAIEEFVRVTGSAVGYLFLYDEAAERLTLFNWSASARRACRIADPPTVHALAGTGLLGEAVRQRRAVITNDYGADDPAKRGLPEGHVALTRHLNVPIFSEGQIVAVAGVGNKEAPYDDDDEQSLTLLGQGALEIYQRKRREEDVHVYQRSLQWLVRRLSLVEEEERRRIAGELHDTIVQDLAAVRLQVAALRDEEPEAVRREQLTDVAAALERAIGYSRALTYELSSPLLHQFGIEAALPWLAEQTGRRHGIRVRCECTAARLGLPDDRAILLYGVAQELLRNVVKHSAASRAVVRLREEGGRARLEVEDDGQGFRASGPRSGATERGGFGLFSIRERLRDAGGTMRVETTSGHGTRVVVELPQDGGAGRPGR